MPYLIFLSAFLLYLRTLAPSITVGDAGEFCASAVTLAVPHSPGYPLFVLLGKLFAVLIPFGSYAFRINILSAACAAAAVALLYVLVRSLFAEEGKNAGLIALVPAAFAAVSPAVWRTAVQTEVFSLNILFAALILLCLQKEKVLAAVYLLGLGLGNHHTLLAVAPFVAFRLYRKGYLTTAGILKASALFLLGFSVYLYLPVRSFKDPSLDWGNAETLNNIWRVISRADYGSLSLTTGAKLERTASTMLAQLARFLKAFAAQFSFAGMLLGAVGIWHGFRKRSEFLISTAALWFLAGPVFLLVANMRFDAEAEGILERFYILVNILWAVPLAYGAQYFAERFRRASAVSAVCLGLACVFAGQNFANMDWRGYYLEYDYGRNLLRTLKPGSIFFMDGGDDTFYSTAYLCFAEKRRPDIELHDRGGLVFRNIYGPDFRRLSRAEKDERRRQVEGAYLGIRPVYYSTFNDSVLRPVKMAVDGMLLTPAASLNANSWPAYSLRGVYDRRYDDYRSIALVPVYPYYAAILFPEKKALYRKFALKEWGDCIWLNSNLRVDLLKEAYAEYSAGRREAAERSYYEITELFPDEVSAWTNLGVIMKDKGDRKKAKECYVRAAEADPRSPDPYYNLAVLYWEEGSWNEVIANLRQVLAVAPNDQRALHYLPLAEQKMRQ